MMTFFEGNTQYQYPFWNYVFTKKEGKTISTKHDGQLIITKISLPKRFFSLNSIENHKMAAYNPAIHHRRSIRLKDYDYAQEGFYFITICCQDRAQLFGEIVAGELILNECGEIADNCWLEIPNHFPNVELHDYIIMPNHVHGIIEIKFKSIFQTVVGANDITTVGANDITTVGANDITTVGANDITTVGANDYSPLRSENRLLPRSPSKTIGSIVRGFKIGVTKWMRQNTNIHNVWQRNYFDHIIRDEQSYQRIANYIRNNPKNWNEDRFYIQKT